MCPLLESVWYFSCDRAGVMSLGGDHGDKVPLSSQHVKGTYFQRDPRLLLSPAPLAGLGSVRLPTVKSSLPPSTLCSLGRSHHGQPALGAGGPRPREGHVMTGQRQICRCWPGRLWGGHSLVTGSRQELEEAVPGASAERVALPHSGLSAVARISDFQPPEP